MYMNDPVFSIIAPVFNENEILPQLVARVREVMETTGETWEFVRMNVFVLLYLPAILDTSLQLQLVWTILVGKLW
jgi:hypothetical protein